ncbi:unnamed protein product [Lampetra planeri]
MTQRDLDNSRPRRERRSRGQSHIVTKRGQCCPISLRSTHRRDFTQKSDGGGMLKTDRAKASVCCCGLCNEGPRSHLPCPIATTAAVTVGSQKAAKHRLAEHPRRGRRRRT